MSRDSEVIGGFSQRWVPHYREHDLSDDQRRQQRFWWIPKAVSIGVGL